jgi:Flp pilus assembly protein TadG
LPVNSPVRWASFAEATAPTLFCLKRWTTRQPKSESGQAAVELALVVPVICLLVLALVDFGKGLNYWLNANQLANLGSRQAAVIGTDPQPNGNLAGWVQSQAETSELRNGTGSVTSPARVCINFVPKPDPNQSGSTGQVGDPVKVTVTAPYKWIPFVGGATLNITATSTMRLERQPDPSLDGECSS